MECTVVVLGKKKMMMGTSFSIHLCAEKKASTRLDVLGSSSSATEGFREWRAAS